MTLSFSTTKDIVPIDSLPLLNLSDCTRERVLEYFENSWQLSEVLFSALSTEQSFYYVPYHRLRHPLIFYYGHSAVLYVNKFKLAGLIKEGINPSFEEIFATGVDEMSWDDMSKNDRPWPKLSEVKAYRKSVYQLVQNIIQNHSGFEQLPITKDNPCWAVLMGFEHERIHIETSSVLMRELPSNLLNKPEQWPHYFPLVETGITQPQQGVHYCANRMIYVSPDNVKLGKPDDWPTYGWDNEYGQSNVAVASFQASEFLISNGEFLEFVKANGYEIKQYWSEEGWRWRNFRKIIQPTFWVKSHGGYKLRICFEEVAMQWNWPVNVNYHEAYAYCTWRSEHEKQSIPYRLISEAEHHRMRTPSKNDLIMKNNGLQMREDKININLAYGSEFAVNAGYPTESGFYDVMGNVWEWCNTHFAPLSGFKTNSLYEDFSTPCFDANHNIIMGGSFISTGDEASKWARFHFRRHFFQHAGFRIAQSSL